MTILHPSECSTLQHDVSVLCIDVRENFEYVTENIGWKNVPMNEVFAFLKEEKIPKNRRILILCNSGKRASALGNLLETEGAYSDICVVEEGMQGWNGWIETQQT